ncbi:flagellar hook-basal body complex protein FliE [Exilibacterium tricleocarpae]|uniref:Flagellar hook-basal body complex protein FliE n=1 Tax=Exilibacterium tricleocarpae TaxID=2591008 RepID=A0A545U3W3_9GAMM|nr:flagellar hook-basal body complex protein FliE [Exilibacterium tricleocarpae]TQV84162.1 flagellar hook-basal body complex protein FliE [Exilibacterium tricleocarpae]
MTDRVDINRLLVEMRSLKSQTQAFAPAAHLAPKDVADSGVRPGVAVQQPRETQSFGALLEQAIDKVNDVQKASGALSKAYTQGDPTVDITEVMIASQKAGVSFQAMVQVRNKLLEAYRDVMNMPV